MPAAAARNLRHPSVQDDVAASTHTASPQIAPPQAAPRARTNRPGRAHPSRHRQPAHHSPRPRTATVATPATVQDWEQVRSLVEHFHESDTGTQAQEARAVRRRALRRHRPFHLSLLSIAICAWMFGMLVVLLWWGSRAQTALDHSIDLDREITRMRLEIGDAQKKISALDSSPHLSRWARQRGWTQATSERIDDVTKSVPPKITNPDRSTPAAAEREPARSGGERR